MPSQPPAAATLSPAEELGRAARTLFALNRLDLARPVAELALELDPQIGNLHSVMAGILDELGEPDAALAHWRRADALMPNAPQQRFNLALALLGRGDFAAGLERYEARMAKPDWVPQASRASIAASSAKLLQPGAELRDRRILVFTEQGLGDCIMFARYINLLAERGAHVTLVCKPALRPLLAGLDGVETLLSPPAEQPHGKINLAAIEFDAFAPLLSLPRIFGAGPGRIRAKTPYLRADPAEISAWRARFAGAGRDGARKVGLVFRANPESGSALDRSMQVADLLPLRDVAGVDFVNLQHGPAGRELAAHFPGLIDATAEDMPLDRFAAAVAATDLLITVDTMAAHCAGALAHPAWVAVPAAPFWYWRKTEGLPDSASPWYPSATVFRAGRRRRWDDVVAALAARLRAG